MYIRFFNTYEPVTSLFRDVPPVLAEQGHTVELVISRAEYRQARGLEDVYARHERVRVRWIGEGTRAAKGMLAKAWIALSYSIGASIRILLGPPARMNVFLTQPPLFCFWGGFLASLRRQRTVYMIMDLQPQLSAALGVISERSVVYRLVRAVSAFALRQADRVIVIGRCMQEAVAALGVPVERIRYVPNWANESMIMPSEPDRNEVRRRLGWEGRVVIGYAGNIGVPQDFTSFVDVAASLENDGRFLFVIIGEGVRKSDLEAVVMERRIGNVQFLPFLHGEHPLGVVLSAVDVHFVSLVDGCTGLAVPSKAYSIMAAGRPMIFQGSARSETARLIREHDLGTVVSAGDSRGLRDAIERLGLEGGAEAGRRARRLAETDCSVSAMTSRYLSALGVVNAE